MPPRSPRRRGASQRWLIVAFILTALILLVDASMHARSPQLQRTLGRQAWLDAIIPQITSSTTQGAEISDITAKKLTGSAREIADQLSSIAAQTGSIYRSVRSTNPPADLATAAGLLDACLLARQEGAAGLAAAVQRLASGQREASVLTAMSSAASDFQLGDSAYRLFASDLPNLGLTMPSSKWDDPSEYDGKALAMFAGRILAAREGNAAPALTISAVSTQPRPLDIESGVSVLSPGSSVSVVVVLTNGTTALEKGVKVSASVVPATGSGTTTQTIDLGAGQSYALTLAPLVLEPSVISAVTVDAELPGATPLTRQLRVVAPGPNFQGVPTTTSTTSRPGGATSSSSSANTSTNTSTSTSTSTPTSTSSSTSTSG